MKIALSILGFAAILVLMYCLLHIGLVCIKDGDIIQKYLGWFILFLDGTGFAFLGCQVLHKK